MSVLVKNDFNRHAGILGPLNGDLKIQKNIFCMLKLTFSFNYR